MKSAQDLRNALTNCKQISAQAFYSKGHDVVLLPENWTNSITRRIDRIQWIQEPCKTMYCPDWLQMQHPISENISGYKQRGMDQEHNKLRDTPESWKLIALDLMIRSPLMSAFHALCNFTLCDIAFWDGTEHLAWHWDGNDSADVFFLIYFTDGQNWDAGDPGTLIIGERSVDDCDWLSSPVDSEVVELARIAPANGLCVVLNNRDPRFVHKVDMLQQYRKRVVFSAGFKISN